MYHNNMIVGSNDKLFADQHMRPTAMLSVYSTLILLPKPDELFGTHENTSYVPSTTHVHLIIIMLAC